ncbi:MAG: DUF3105 domain-containing protein [Actinomycetota bacterium]|nr:DUF3105 domain-containing protein [Actinomycetota bacterium]
MPKRKPPQKKRRAAPEAAESHQRRQERLEARRRAKQEALLAQRRRERRERATRSAVLITLLLAAIYFVFLRETAPESIQGNRISQFSTSNGASTNTHTPPFNYTEETTGVKPPVSGNHDPTPAACGTHDQKIPDENLVHSLEHGAAAILYDPDVVAIEDIRTIEGIVNDRGEDTISAPYRGMPDPVTVASWSRKMGLDEVDAPAIREYVETFADTEPAPEAAQDQAECDNEEDETFDPAEDLEPSPSPEPTPTETEPADGGNNKGDAKGDDDKDDKGGDKAKMKKEEEGK